MPGARCACNASPLSDGDTHSGGHQRLDDDRVVAGVGDAWREAGALACRDRGGSTAFAAADPGGVTVVLETLIGLVTDEVEGVVQQVGESESFLLERSVGVPEDQGDVDVSGTQHLQALDRVGIDEVQLDSRVRPGQLGGCLRYEGAEDRLETGESYPSGAKSHAGGQLDGCGVHPPQDLGRPSAPVAPLRG